MKSMCKFGLTSDMNSSSTLEIVTADSAGFSRGGAVFFLSVSCGCHRLGPSSDNEQGGGPFQLIPSFSHQASLQTLWGRTGVSVIGCSLSICSQTADERANDGEA